MFMIEAANFNEFGIKRLRTSKAVENKRDS
jgi:hypothetical protein